MADVPLSAVRGVSPAEVEHVELYHPHSWVTKYVFSQEAQVLAIQYSFTAMAVGLVALVLSSLMRMQMALPGLLPSIAATAHYQVITMPAIMLVVSVLPA